MSSTDIRNDRRPDENGRRRVHAALIAVFAVGTAIVIFIAYSWSTSSGPFGHYRPHGHQDMTIDVSPTGDAILFNAKGQGGRDLYLLKLSDGFAVQRIAETVDYEVCPTFSPDGDWIAYAAGVPRDCADHLFKMRRDGTRREQLTTARANDTAPAWSPDGKLIAFARDKTYDWGGLGANWSEGGVICVVNSDGTNERQLTPDNQYSSSPKFLPDGKTIIYSTASGLYSVGIDKGSGPRRLGPAGWHTSSPAGKEIVFADGRFAPDFELFLSNLDGSQRRQITDSDKGCFHPVFSKKDDQIYFLMEEWPDGSFGHPKWNIWSVMIDGKDQELVSDFTLFDDPLHWKGQSK